MSGTNSENGHRDALLAALRRAGIDGSDDEVLPKAQIFLLGGNPLPIRIAIGAMQPTRVCLVTTHEAANDDAVGALQTQCSKLGVERVEVVYIDDHTVRGDVFKALDNAHVALGARIFGLNYTGGTKSMARHAGAWFEARYGEAAPLHRCSYLAPKRGALVFDGVNTHIAGNTGDGASIAGVHVTLDEMFALHGIRAAKMDVRIPESCDDRPEPDDGGWHQRTQAQRIGEFVFSDANRFDERWAEYLGKLPPIYGIRVDVSPSARGVAVSRHDGTPVVFDRESDDHEEPRDADVLPNGRLRLEGARATHGSNFSAKGRLAPDKWAWNPLAKLLGLEGETTLDALTGGERAPSGSKYKRGDRETWFTSFWFEEWFSATLAESGYFDELWTNVEVERQSDTGKQPFRSELDIVARRGSKLVVGSLTVDAKKERTKLKAAEAMVRASQIGGDLARYFVATMTPSDGLRALWAELDSHWAGYDRLRVFGVPHHCGEKGVSSGSVTEYTLMETLDEWLT